MQNMNGTTVKRICSNFPTVVLLVMSITTSKLLVCINVKKTTVLNTLVTMTMTSDVENSKN